MIEIYSEIMSEFNLSFCVGWFPARPACVCTLTVNHCILRVRYTCTEHEVENGIQKQRDLIGRSINHTLPVLPTRVQLRSYFIITVQLYNRV